MKRMHVVLHVVVCLLICIAAAGCRTQTWEPIPLNSVPGYADVQGPDRMSGYPTEESFYRWLHTLSTTMTNIVNEYNHQIDEFVRDPAPVELLVLSRHVEGKFVVFTKGKSITISRPDEVRQLFQHLKTADMDAGMKDHFCDGNVKIIFPFRGNRQLISFDHASIISSSFLQDVGDRDCSPSNAAYVVQFLREHGFSDDEIGVEKGGQQPGPRDGVPAAHDP